MNSVFRSEYWHKRYVDAVHRGHVHQAVYECTDFAWEAAVAFHRRVLKAHILLTDSVLDVGCGWGRLLTLMPDGWQGYYCGVDLAKCFIDLARAKHTDRTFLCLDVRCMPFPDVKYDWAVLVGVRHMVRGQAGEEHWQQMEKVLRTVCKRIMVLEYDETNEVIEC